MDEIGIDGKLIGLTHTVFSIYPFEGIGAVVDEISLVTKTVTVTIYPGKGSITIQLPMDNVLYSVYNNYDEDNLESPETEIDISQIPDGSTEELLNSKQY